MNLRQCMFSFTPLLWLWPGNYAVPSENIAGLVPPAVQLAATAEARIERPIENEQDALGYMTELDA